MLVIVSRNALNLFLDADDQVGTEMYTLRCQYTSGRTVWFNAEANLDQHQCPCPSQDEKHNGIIDPNTTATICLLEGMSCVSSKRGIT